MKTTAYHQFLEFLMGLHDRSGVAKARFYDVIDTRLYDWGSLLIARHFLEFTDLLLAAGNRESLAVQVHMGNRESGR